ncbi:MAG: hypothetical protein H8E87_06070, partial [FCB group bacterium]|nr:hypothetical protein [FCB group bacterium]
MTKRENFIWGFLIVVAILIIFYSGVKTYTITKQVKEFQLEESKAILGTDPQLLETVNTLEDELKERLNYVFKIEKDPLKLSEVVKSPKLLAALGYGAGFEGVEDMRLNLTVIGEERYASVKYMGNYYNLKINDNFGGFKVTNIEIKSVTLMKGSQKVVLYNRLDPETLAEQAKL